MGSSMSTVTKHPTKALPSLFCYCAVKPTFDITGHNVGGHDENVGHTDYFFKCIIC